MNIQYKLNFNFNPDALVEVRQPIIHWLRYIDGNATASPDLTELIDGYYFEN
jgi:hypothetical protein